jgi:DNA polymerase-3 subunit gamma/tau
MSEENTSQPYRVLARKYRPQNFNDLIGQEPMVQTLSNAFKTGRIAQAYMLTGVRGVGKTTTARILARALNYKNGDIDQPTIDLAQEGEHCRAIIEGRHMDIIEMDAASNTGIDDMRDLIESAQYRPASARYKVYIIDEVHMLSKSAFNGLLKTLEEPPEHVKFIFATTEIRKVPVTVLSRCQRFDLRRIEAGTLTQHLADICEKENVKAETDALAMVARAGDGSVRDALSMLDQAIAHGAGEGDTGITAESMRDMLGLSDRARIVDLFESIMKGDIAAALAELKSQYDTGAEPELVLTDLADFIHLVTRLKYVPDTQNDGSLTEIEKTRGKEFSEKLSVRILGRAWQMLLKGLSEVGSAERPLAAAEMVLVRLTHASSLPTPDELLKEMNQSGEATRTSPLSASESPAQGASANADATAGSPNGGSPSALSPTQPVMSSGQSGSGASNVVAMKPAEPEPVFQAPQPATEEQNFKTLNSFDELIFLIEDKRDLALKTLIKRHVRLVSFVDGRMEMNLVENAPRDFLGTLGKRLEEWTGKRWVLSISAEQGHPTLAEQEAQENDARMDDAKSDPAVEAIMMQFPGARIIDIRVREEEEILPPAPEEKDDDELGEFFE